MTDTLNPGDSLTAGQSISSANGRYLFVYQEDCNLVLYKIYRDQSRRHLWDSDSWGKPAGFCVMQSDGNLVIYDSNRQDVWASLTYGNPNSRLVVQDDGNVVIYRPDNTYVWDTKTWQPPIPPTEPVAQGDDMQPGEVLNPGQSISSANGQYTLIYQDDANLVLYRNQDRIHLWASNTWDKPKEVCVMQADGNLVIFDPDGNSIWHSGTWQHPRSRLVVENIGNVGIYNPDNELVWETDTAYPKITELRPGGEERGEEVKIIGKNFWEIVQVTFNGESARYTHKTSTEIIAVVPPSATTGRVNVSTPNGTAVSPYSFRVWPSEGGEGPDGSGEVEPPEQGTVYVTLYKDSANPGVCSGESTNPLAAWPGEHAKIAQVKNGGPHLSLAHKDRNGAGTGFVILDSNQSTASPFAGLEVEGSWTAQVSGDVDEVPITVSIKVDWVK